MGSYVENNTNYTSIQNLAQRASVALVFVYSDSGEAFLTVEGNSGDRNNLNLWDCGDDLVKTISVSKAFFLKTSTPPSHTHSILTPASTCCLL